MSLAGFSLISAIMRVFFFFFLNNKLSFPPTSPTEGCSPGGSLNASHVQTFTPYTVVIMLRQCLSATPSGPTGVQDRWFPAPRLRHCEGGFAPSLVSPVTKVAEFLFLQLRHHIVCHIIFLSRLSCRGAGALCVVIKGSPSTHVS